MKPETARDPASIRILFRSIWIGGLVLTVVMGIAARFALQAQGVSVVSWSQGISLVIPLAILFEIPFLVLAYVARKNLRRAVAEEPASLQMRFHVLVGALAGQLVLFGYMIFGMLSYSGPGGLGEVVAMFLVMWMLTIPYLLFYGLIGAAFGGAFGWVVWKLRALLGPSHGH